MCIFVQMRLDTVWTTKTHFEGPVCRIYRNNILYRVFICISPENKKILCFYFLKISLLYLRFYGGPKQTNQRGLKTTFCIFCCHTHLEGKNPTYWTFNVDSWDVDWILTCRWRLFQSVFSFLFAMSVLLTHGYVKQQKQHLS